MKTTTLKVEKQVKIALLSSISFILMFINTSVPIFPAFLKVDISDLPSIIALTTMGIGPAIWTSFIKNLLHILVSQSFGIGELINFIMSSSFIFIIHIVYQRTKKMHIALISSTLFTSLMAVPVNYFIMFPLYQHILHIQPENILSMAKNFNPMITSFLWYFALIIVPFNALKFSIVSFIFHFTGPLIAKNIKLK